MRQSQDHHGAADRDIEVYIYTPLNEGITSATHRRLEGYLRKLQPEEIGRFVRLVKSVRAELAGEDKKEDDIEHHDREEGPKIERLEGMLFERDSQLAKLRKQVDQRDTKSEDDEAKASEWRSLRDKLEEKTKRLRDQKALTEGLNDELKIWRDLDAKRASVSRGNAGNADDIAAGTGEGDADGADDDAPTFDHADDFESSVNGTGLSKKPETRRASTKKPLPTNLLMPQRPGPLA
jgi:vacuolar-type H+-ATPase subunit I/STV1